MAITNINLISKFRPGPLKNFIRPKFFITVLLIFIAGFFAYKGAYAFLAAKFPLITQPALDKFEIQTLVTDIQARLAYLTPRVKGVRFMIYKIKMKDNLWLIAKRNGYSVHTIIGCNPQLETYEVNYNQRIILPSYPGTLHPVQQNDTFDSIAKRYDITPEKLKEFNYSRKLLPGELVFIPGKRPDISLLNEKMREKYEWRSLFVWPLPGKITSNFGRRRHPITGTNSFHGGIDIAVKEGTWVGAAADGVVILASHDVGHYGTAIFIDHQNGYVTHYGHLSKIFVRTGQKVKAGKLIAKSGSTGRSTGPHLHFTIKKNDQPINPRKFLW
jgi:murein DD-endopeptidase MepM/ murein hydrolase activator NlpD